MAKAVTDFTPWSSGPTLSSLANTPQTKAAAYLKAYKVGWFYKAGKKIADDISALDWSLSDGDAEEGEDETELPKPDLQAPFASLGPIDQLQRLLERPNPSQTGRQLIRKTEVRLDFAGAAFWYLENATSGLPTALYGISPARMWPAYGRDNQLIGWVMDKDSPNPVPFDVLEILPFATGNADDDDIWGTSVVEAVYSQVPLTDLMARHTGNVLTTGGRLAGMLWPKDRALGEDEFLDAQRAWRNVASDPNAGKKLLIFPEPMEYAAGASTPAEIGIPELAQLNRDEICTAFPVDPRILGVPFAEGMNASGEVRRELRKDYWEGTIHPRVDLLTEVIQVGLVSRYEEATGQTYDFAFDEPDLDDAASLSAKAEAYKSLISIGLDPEESVAAVGLDHIKWNGLPDLLDPAKQAQAAEEARQAAAQQPQNDEPPPAGPQSPRPTRSLKSRDDIAARGKEPLERFFAEQRTRVAEAIKGMPAAKAKRAEAIKSPDWWDSKTENDALARALKLIYTDAGQAGMQLVANTLDRIIPNKAVARIVADLSNQAGSRILDINQKTLDALQDVLSEGARRGYSIPQLIDGVPEEGYPGLAGVTLENGTPAFSDARAETIARTETAISYNRATLDGYREFGVDKVLAYDGDEDPECAARDQQVFTLDEALSIADHPNGTLDWAPVLDKAAHEPQPPVVVNVAFPEFKFPEMPDVHVEGPVVNNYLPEPPQPAKSEDAVNQTFIIGDREAIKSLEPAPTPIVNVEQPDLTPVLDAIKALAEREQPTPQVTVKTPAEMRITAMPERVTRKRVKRDQKGRVTETDEVESDA
jgi:phage portal protein BeeE